MMFAVLLVMKCVIYTYTMLLCSNINKLLWFFYNRRMPLRAAVHACSCRHPLAFRGSDVVAHLIERGQH
jgi:hypothetical protein